MTSATPPTNDADRLRDEVVKRMIATPPQAKPKPPSESKPPKKRA